MFRGTSLLKSELYSDMNGVVLKLKFLFWDNAFPKLYKITTRISTSTQSKKANEKK